MIPADTKVYFAREPADFRKSFDGLAATCLAALSMDPRQGGLFVFFNRRRTQVRVLFRDPHGWCLLSKRLDRGRFRRLRNETKAAYSQTEVRELMAFLDDIDFATRPNTRRPNRRLQIVPPPPTSPLQPRP